MKNVESREMKFLGIFLLILSHAAAQSWVQIQDFPGLERDDGVGVTVNDKFFAGTGLQVGWVPARDFYSLDRLTLTWSRIADMPDGTARQYACAFPGNGCFYVFGGDNGVPLNDLYKYDIATNSWSAMTPKPGPGIQGAVALSFGDKVCIAGGKTTAGAISSEVWEYNAATDTWLQKTDMPEGRWRAAGDATGDKGFVMMGFDGNGSYRKEIYEYTHSSDSWTKKNDFPLSPPRGYATLKVQEGSHLFLFGGQDTAALFYKTVAHCRISDMNWTHRLQFPSTGRRGGMAGMINEFFIYACGLSEGDTRERETWMMTLPLGSDENAFHAGYRVYPNPARGYFNVQPGNAAPFGIYLYDAQGRNVLYEKEFSGPVQTDQLPRGIYFLKMVSSTAAYTQRLILE